MKFLFLKFIGLFLEKILPTFWQPIEILLNASRKYYLFGNKEFWISYKALLKYPENISIGKKSVIGNCTIGARSNVIIGENVTISQGAIIETGSLTLSGESRHKSKPIIIEDNCWIAVNAIILGGSIIRKNSLIGAGVVVSGDIPENSIIRK